MAAGAEAASEASAAPFPLLAEVLDQLEDGVCVLDAGLRVAAVNAAAERHFGLPRGMLLGRALFRTVPSLAGCDLGRALAAAAADGRSRSLEAPSVLRPGRWFRSRILGQDGALALIFRDITEERRRDADIAASEERLLLAQEAAGVGTWDWESDGERLRWSEAHARLCGLSPGTAPGSLGDWLALVLPPDRAAVAAAVTGLLAAAGEVRIEFRIRRASDGAERWIASHGRVLRRDPVTGAATRVVGASLDVTGRRDAEAALRAAEARWRTLFRSAPLPALLIDPESLRLVAGNDRAGAWLGHDGAALSRLALADIEAVPDEAQARHCIATLLARPGRIEFETRYRLASGAVRDVLATAEAVEVDGRQLIQLLCLDITARKQAEQGLRDAERRFRALAETAGMVLRATSDGAVTEVAGWEAATGLPTGACRGEGWLEALHDEDRAPIAALWQEALAAPRPVAARFRLRAAAGGWRWTALRAVPVPAEEGRLAEWTGLLVDIDAGVIAAEALAASEARLRLAQEAAGLGLWELDLETRVSRISPLLAMLYGYPPGMQTMDDARWIARVYPEDLAGAAILHPATDVPERLDREFRIRRADTGETRWLQSRGRRLLPEPGQPPRMIGVTSDITERKQAEIAHRTARERLEVALHGADLGTWQLDPRSGDCLYDARAAAILGDPWSEAPRPRDERWLRIHPEDRDRVFAAGEAHFAGRTPAFEAEYRIRHATGRWVWVLSRGRVVERDAAGGPMLVIGTFLDITGRKASDEAQLRRTEALRAMLDANPIGMTRIAADGTVVDANESALRAMGLTREDLQAGRIHRGCRTPPEWAAADAAAEEELLLRGHCTPYEKEYELPDGRRIPVLVGFAMIDRSRGERAGFVLDLSAMKRTEARLKASERAARQALEELETLYRTAPLGLCQLDRELRYVRVNDALAANNGLPPEAHIGRRCVDVVTRMSTEIGPLLRHVLETGETVRDLEVSGETPLAPGIRRDWIEQLYPVRDPETGAITGVGAVVEEVTERKAAERARDLLLRELDHRVKNLFAVIDGLVHFGAREAATPPEMAGLLSGRIRALARAHDLVRPAIAGMADGGGARTTLARLMQEILAPFANPGRASGRAAFEGPEVALGITAAPILGLVLNELATNAAKHGALARADGHVALRWEADMDGMLRLVWQEQGGPPVDRVPERAGFGSRLIRQGIAGQLGGEFRTEWRPEGLRLEIDLPLRRLER
jgi:PAS domain S-box-containing protein